MGWSLNVFAVAMHVILWAITAVSSNIYYKYAHILQDCYTPYGVCWTPRLILWGILNWLGFKR